MKTLLKIVIVLLLAFAVSHAINDWIFGDSPLFAPSSVVTWLILAALVTSLFVRGDRKPDDGSDRP